MATRLLVVDNEVTCRALGRSLFGALEVDYASNAKDALTKVVLGHFDVVLCASSVDGTDGRLLLGLTAEIAPHAVRLLFTGAAVIATLNHAGGTREADLVVTKPVSRDKLLDVLAWAGDLARRRASGLPDGIGYERPMARLG